MMNINNFKKIISKILISTLLMTYAVPVFGAEGFVPEAEYFDVETQSVCIATPDAVAAEAVEEADIESLSIAEEPDETATPSFFANLLKTSGKNSGIRFLENGSNENWEFEIYEATFCNIIPEAYLEEARGLGITTEQQRKYIVIKNYIGDPAENIVIPDAIDDMPVYGVLSEKFRNGRYYSIFSDAGFTEDYCVEIPAALQRLSAAAFVDEPNLVGFTMSGEGDVYTVENGVIFTKDGKSLVCYPAGKTDESYQIPLDVKEIRDRAFYGQKHLDTLDVGSADIGKYAFRYAAVKSVSGSPKTLGKMAFAETGLKNVSFAEERDEIPDLCFFGNGSLETVDLGPVRKISDYAFFGCGALTNVNASGTQEVGEGCFAYCRNLTDYTLPATVNAINNWSFAYCEKLKGLALPEAIKDIPAYCFIGNISVKSIGTGPESDIVLPTGLESIGNYAFCACGNAETLILPDGIRLIGDYAFNDCENISSVRLPESVESIGDYSFARCILLAEISIPENIRHIGNEAFHFSGFTGELYIPKATEEIGDGILGDCDFATGIVVHPDNENYVSVDGVLFTKDMTALKQFPPALATSSYVIPETVISVREGAFRGSMTLEKVIIPDSVDEIGFCAFVDSFALKEVIIGRRIRFVDYSAFGFDSLHHIGKNSVIRVPNDTARLLFEDGTNYYGADGYTRIEPYDVETNEPIALVIDSLPKKTEYLDNEKLEFDGLSLSLKYADGSLEPLSLSNRWLSLPQSEKLPIGDIDLIVAYTATNEKILEASFKITVESSIRDIDIFYSTQIGWEKVETRKLEVGTVIEEKWIGENVLPKGMVSSGRVFRNEAGYEDGSISYDIPYRIRKDDSALYFESYAEKRPVSLEITALPTKREFYVGDLLVYDGLKATVHFSDGSTKKYKVGAGVDYYLTEEDTEVIIAYPVTPTLYVTATYQITVRPKE